MLACHEDTSGWGTNCITRVGSAEFHSVSCKLVQIRCLNEFLSIATQFSPAQVVSHDKDNIGLTSRNNTSKTYEEKEDLIEGFHCKKALAESGLSTQNPLRANETYKYC